MFRSAKIAADDAWVQRLDTPQSLWIGEQLEESMSIAVRGVLAHTVLSMSDDLAPTIHSGCALA